MTLTPTQLQSYANSQSPLHGELAEVARELIRKSEEIAILSKALEALQRRTARHDHAKDLGQAVDGDAAIMSRLTFERDAAKAALTETAAQRDAAVKRVGELEAKLDESENFARIMADAADANVSAKASERMHHLHTLRIMRRIMEESASYLQTTTRQAAQMALNDGEQAGLK